MKLQNIPRLLRTVRHLHWSQPAWRVCRIAQHRLGNLVPATSVVDDSPAEAWPETAIIPSVPLPPGPGTDGADLIESLEQGIFHHLHERRRVGRSTPDWRLGPQAADRLWTVTLHGHRWVYDLSVLVRRGGALGARAAALLHHYWLDWIRRCDISQQGTYPLAWNAYAIATRLSWWTQAYRLLGEPFMAARPELRSALLLSFRRQAEFLRRHVEWDLRGNHLLRDAVGLASAGRFLHGRQAVRWLAVATDLAVQQVAEQVLPDGGHFERSPMYHLEVMHDLLALAALLTEPTAVTRIQAAWRSMAECAAWWRHPDGMTAQLNDGGRRVAAATLALGRRIGVDVPLCPRRGGRHWDSSGLVVWHGRPWSVLLDVGEIGPQCQPGHAHADTLTLESSFAGRRLFVDPGSYAYDDDARRRYDRSTQAHNTVCVDRTDSSELWHIFRVGRRAHPRSVRVVIEGDGLTAEAGHNGYDHLPGRPRHRRRITVRDGGSLEVSDQIEGRYHHHVQGGLLLAPEWAARPAAGGWQLVCGTTRLRVRIDAARDLTLDQQPAVVHPAYGSEDQTTRLTWHYDGLLPLSVRTVVYRC